MAKSSASNTGWMAQLTGGVLGVAVLLVVAGALYILLTALNVVEPIALGA